MRRTLSRPTVSSGRDFDLDAALPREPRATIFSKVPRRLAARTTYCRERVQRGHGGGFLADGQLSPLSVMLYAARELGGKQPARIKSTVFITHAF